MLMCTTTLEKMSFEEFSWMHRASPEGWKIIEEWIGVNCVTDRRAIHHAYEHRTEMPGLAEVEVPA